MDGYTLTEKMRKARRRFRFTAVEQALFHELVAVCNGEDWRDIFDCSNKELCYVLDITEKTLIKARESLINSGIVFYQSGKSRRDVGKYSFNKPFKVEKPKPPKTTVIIPADTTVDSTVDSTVDPTVDSKANSPDIIYKHKTETETKEEKYKKEFPFADVIFMEPFLEWLAYKNDRNEKFKSERSIKACYTHLVNLSGNSPDIAKRIVQQSMANNWQGLFELKNKPQEDHGIGVWVDNGRKYYGSKLSPVEIPMNAPKRTESNSVYYPNQNKWMVE